MRKPRDGPHALTRRALPDPDVPIDTNRVERDAALGATRSDDLEPGRTEPGARHVGTRHGLIVSCRLQRTDSCDDLADMLQRVGRHPAGARVGKPTRRPCATHVAAPLRSAAHGHTVRATTPAGYRLPVEGLLGARGCTPAGAGYAFGPRGGSAGMPDATRLMQVTMLPGSSYSRPSKLSACAMAMPRP